MIVMGEWNMYHKTVDVVVLNKAEGGIIPLFIVWDDGRKFKITQSFSVGQRVSLSEGCGNLYYIIIKNKQKKLYHDVVHNNWFLEMQEDMGNQF